MSPKAGKIVEGSALREDTLTVDAIIVSKGGVNHGNQKICMLRM
jgi:hypothetical protein